MPQHVYTAESDFGEVDNTALEAALQRHSLALRRYLEDWTLGQDQILASGLRNATVDAIPTRPSKTANINMNLPVTLEGMQTRNGNTLGIISSEEGTFSSAPKDGSLPTFTGRSFTTFEGCGHQSTPTNRKHYGGRPTTTASDLVKTRTLADEFRNQLPVAPGLARQHGYISKSTGPIFEAIQATEEFNRRFDCPRLQIFEESSIFGAISAMVIVLNAISMAVGADYEMNNFQEPVNRTLVTLDFTFVVIYTVELIFRIAVRRLHFFSKAWSWFDVIIVAVGWVEVSSASATKLTQVRLLRILKMAKVMRVLRAMRSLREVKMLLNSLMGSVKPLLWTVIIITVFNFMFGICFVQSVAAFRREVWLNEINSTATEADSIERVPELPHLIDHWNSVPQAMYTLFKASTGGVNWGEVADPLLVAGWQNLGIFLLYIALFLFVMTNAVTAIFVSSADEYANKDSYMAYVDQLGKKEEYTKLILTLYQKMDQDNSGEVSKEEFMQYVDDPRMIEFASNLEIDVLDLEQFFDVLSAHATRAVDLDTFVDGCIKLRGAARSMDIYDLLIQQRMLGSEVKNIRRMLNRSRPGAESL